MGQANNPFGGFFGGLKSVGDAIGGAANAAADAVGSAANAVGDAVGGAANTVAEAAKPVTDVVAEAGSAAIDVAGGVAGSVADAVGGAVKDTAEALGAPVADESKTNLTDANGVYILPDPLVSERECGELDVLTERYAELNRPGLVARAGDAISSVIPEAVKGAVAGASRELTEAEYYKAAMEIVANGFSAIERQAANATVTPEYVVSRINRGKQPERVESLREVCMLRSYDVARVANDERAQHMGLAVVEGAATGVPGFAGIPFNIVLSTFLYFRAVQSVAMFYGYDVHSDPAEMVISSDVLMAAFGAGEQGRDAGPAVGVVGKIMIISEAEVVRQTVKKGWGAMASRGGVELLITQMRALANAAARKAVEGAGKKGLEKSVFSSVFEQIGKRLSQKVVQGAVPIVGGVIGALFDGGMMDKVLSFAEVFYHKRFIVEKDARVRALIEDRTFDEVLDDGGEGE